MGWGVIEAAMCPMLGGQRADGEDQCGCCNGGRVRGMERDVMLMRRGEFHPPTYLDKRRREGQNGHYAGVLSCLVQLFRVLTWIL
jgi:hypothetical protein